MKKMICIVCPVGCSLKVNDSDLDNIQVTGNGCKRGIKYALDEIVSPKRTVTSIVRVESGEIQMVSGKTTNAVAKELIFDVLEEVRKVYVKAPIYLGDVIIKNILNTGVDFVATKTVLRKIEE
jgi:CxxC motif-containing protein